MPPVAVGVVQALTEGQGVADKLLSLGLVSHLLLLGPALELQGEHTHTQIRERYPVYLTGQGLQNTAGRMERTSTSPHLLDVERCHGDDVVDVGAGADLLYIGQVPVGRETAILATHPGEIGRASCRERV